MTALQLLAALLTRVVAFALAIRWIYHTSAFNVAANGVNAVNTDATFVTDTELRGQNSHLILTAPFKLLAVTLFGANVTRGRWQIPRWNFYGEPTIFASNRLANIPSNPQWDYWGETGPMFPMNQEIQLQISNNLGAATESDSGFVQLGSPDWSRQADSGQLFWFWTRATVTITPTLNAWSGANSITLAQSLLGGTYAIRETIVQGTNAALYRWIFARNRLYHGYRLRPGGMVQNAAGDVITNQFDPTYSHWGTQGWFSTLELPQIEVFGTVAGAITYQVFMLLQYLSESVDAIDRYTTSAGFT